MNTNLTSISPITPNDNSFVTVNFLLNGMNVLPHGLLVRCSTALEIVKINLLMVEPWLFLLLGFSSLGWNRDQIVYLFDVQFICVQ